MLTLGFVAMSFFAGDDLANLFLRGGQDQSGFLPPNHRYRIKVPSGMVVQGPDELDSDLVIFDGDLRGVRAQIIVKRVEVVPGAASSQLMLTTRDDYLSKLPNFTVLGTRKMKIAGRNCSVLVGRHDYQGNRAYPIVIEQAYVIDGTDGFVIGAELPLDAYNDVADSLRELYTSFQPLSRAVKGAPATPTVDPQVSPDATAMPAGKTQTKKKKGGVVK